MNENKKTNDIHDLMAAKKEATEQMDTLKGHMLTDEELDMVAGGIGGLCSQCNSPLNDYGVCINCGHKEGDERDMDEALADIDGLTEAGDGFC